LGTKEEALQISNIVERARGTLGELVEPIAAVYLLHFLWLGAIADAHVIEHLANKAEGVDDVIVLAGGK